MKCTCELKSEFATSQNEKYQTEYKGKAVYVGFVMYERCPTLGPNGVGVVQTGILYPKQQCPQSGLIYIITTVHVL